MKKISKVVTASALLFTLVNPLEVFAEGNVTNISTMSENKVTQDVVVNATEVNGEVVFEVAAVKDTYDTVLHATVDGKTFTYNLGNLKKGQVSKVVQVAEGKDATISKENKGPKVLPNTSTVRQLVEKVVNYNNNINGKAIEAKVVYKTYELVEVNDGASTTLVATPPEVKPQPQPTPPEVKPQPQPTPPEVKPQPQPTPPEVKPQPQPTPPEVKPQPQPTPGDVKPQPQPTPPKPKPADGNVITSEVTKADPGNVIVGIKGEFETPNKDAILHEINRIRKEATDQGLTDRYVPIKWSTDLEKTALVRATEASFTVGHHRLTNKKIPTAFSENSLYAGIGESLAWNYSGIDEAIQQWYSEKADFVKKKNGVATTGQVGHYESLINPKYTHMGIAAFRNPKQSNRLITTAQSLAGSGDSEALVGTYGKAVVRTEVAERNLPRLKQLADVE